MKTAVIYVRVSTDTQAQQGTSLDSQEQDLRRYCASNGITVSALHRDAGESAKTADRPGLQAALLAAKGRDFFIVHKLDRLARNTADGLAIRAALRKHGCELVSVTEPAGSDPVGEMVGTVLMAVAQFDNQLRAARSKRGMVEMTKRGGFVSKPPRGFIAGKLNNIPILLPDPKTAPPIRAALQRFASGATAKAGCLLELKAAGIPKQSASHILQKPVYGGLIRSQLIENKTIRAAFDGLISPDEWYRIEAKLASPQLCKIHSLCNQDFILASITTCAVCGTSLLGSFSRGHKGGRYGYYACRHGHVRARADRLHGQIDRMLSEAADLQEIAAEVIQRAAAVTATRLNAIADNRQAAQNRLRASEGMELKLTEGWLAGIVPGDIYQAKIASLRAEQQTYRISAESTDQTIAKGMECLNQMVLKLNSPQKMFNALGPNEKRRFITLMFGSLVLGTNLNLSNPHNDGVCKLLPVVARGAISIGGRGGTRTRKPCGTRS